MKIIVRLSSRASGLRGIGQSPSERAERVDQRTLHKYFSATRMSMSAVDLSWKGAAREGERGGDEDSREDNPSVRRGPIQPGRCGIDSPQPTILVIGRWRSGVKWLAR
jgi:hypothetical protein